MHILDESEVEKTFVERDPIMLSGSAGRSVRGDSDDGGYRDNSGYRGDNDHHGKNNEPPTDGDGTAQPPPASAAVTKPIIGQTRLGFGLVVDAIGVGGMASVYKVWNERLEVFRAVKMLSSDALHARFQTEAKISAKLRHANIVDVYNVGEWNGVPYLEMEYVDGSDLEQVLCERGRLPDAVCIDTALCVANALKYAHTLKFTLGGNSYNGIIHRDLKPANILVSKRGEIKLTDFGIARPLQASLHTREGSIVGTLHYLSPEQMEGGKIDIRSDIYSFGAILYEMTTGSKTFPQKSITELMKHRAANSFKRPDDYCFPVNSALSSIILKCLEIAPEERYQNAAALLEDLQKVCPTVPDGQTRQKYLTGFFTKPSHRPRIETTAVSAKQSGGGIDVVKRLLSKKSFIAIPIIVLAFLLTSFVMMAVISPKPKTAKAKDQAKLFLAVDNTASPTGIDNGSTNADASTNAAVSTSTPVSTPVSTSAAVSTNTAASTSNPTPTSDPTPTPIPPPKPPATEADLLRDATAAIGKKDWDRAIRILERNAAAFTENKSTRTLLLLEAYIESRRLDKALPLLDTAAPTGDALYFLSAGRYWFYKGNHTKSVELLEASLTRSSVLRGRNVIFDDAMYYIAMVRGDRFRAAPTDANRLSALDGWRRVKSAYGARAESPRFKRAEEEIAALN